MKKLLLILPLALLLGGCKSPYDACVKGGNAIAQSIKAAMPTIDTARAQGLMSAQEESNVEDFLEYANKADGAFLTCAKTAKANGNQPGTYTACASAFSTALASPAELTLITVTNPQTQQTINGIVDAIKGGIATVAASLGGA